MSDTIYRQQAIDAIEEMQMPIMRSGSPIDQSVFTGMGRALQAIKDLPSAQPDLDEWCPDCKEYDPKRHCCPRFNKVIRGAYKDLQAERKKGWWVEMGVNADKTHNIVCSKCGEGYKTKGNAKSIATRAKWKFCPSCGADMRGECNV